MPFSYFILKHNRKKNTHLKSGMPLAVDIPAPAITTTFWTCPDDIRAATSSKVLQVVPALP